jgi:hypothetical protein
MKKRYLLRKPIYIEIDIIDRISKISFMQVVKIIPNYIKKARRLILIIYLLKLLKQFLKRMMQ